MNSLFASTGRGLEELLKTELESLGAKELRLVPGGVHFQGNNLVMYRSLMWSRLASRILLPLGEFAVRSDSDLYVGAQSIAWSEIFAAHSSFMVHFKGTNDEIRNSQFGAQRVKDAIADSFTREGLPHPAVDLDYPRIRINAWLYKDNVSIALDLSGDALHLRNYRQGTGQAPLKETLAAAIVLRSGWKKETPLIDPLCGSGTLLIEAAMMAADRAPGLAREHWGFLEWKKHQPAVWEQVVTDARQRASRGMQCRQVQFFGYDNDQQVLKHAQANARRAEVAALISFKSQDITQLKNPCTAGQIGTLISNPPYGERLDSEPALIALHSQLGQRVKQAFGGWQLSLFSGSPMLLDSLQLRAERKFKAKNGPLECVQKNYALRAVAEGTGSAEIAPDFANRLRKNIKKLDKWARQQGIECYRLYDADLPEYNIAIDRYADRVVIQEYSPPKTVDAQKARQRLFDVISVTLQVLALPASRLVLKTRERQKGRQQYQKMATKNDFFAVKEFNAKFWVNLTDYLDTGLFIDHRLARKMLGEMSQGKDFLNLFAYTGTASVYATTGGARSTTTVDLSRTYLEWAERNFQLNEITGRSHRLIQADCLSWMREARESFDLIFIDPPTFSNSKRMEESFDVQRDHLQLMTDLKRLLRRQGIIMFSNNKRAFRMDHQGLAALDLTAREITDKTQSLDFARRRHIHNCWLITHAGEE